MCVGLTVCGHDCVCVGEGAMYVGQFIVIL